MDKQGEKRAVARLFSAIGRCQEAPVSGFEPSVRVPKQCRRTARRRGNPSGRGGALQAPHRTRLVLQNTGNFQCVMSALASLNNGTRLRCIEDMHA